jgi:hypothetical protein
MFVLGLAPNILLSQVRDAVARTISDMSSRTEASPAPAYYRGPIKLVPRRPEAPKAMPATTQPSGGNAANTANAVP